MNVRVYPDRADRRYHYGQTARMKIVATNDDKAPAIVHSVGLRVLAEDWQKIPMGSERVDPGESKCVGRPR